VCDASNCCLYLEWDLSLISSRACLGISSDATLRKNLISNIIALLRFSHGKGVIVTSEAARPIEMRSPGDAMNLCVFVFVFLVLCDHC
jgi:RNase P/RNase MRP subunit p30